MEDAHHSSVESGSIAWPKWHDLECVLLVIGAKESELFLVRGPDADLVVACFVIKTDEREVTGRVTKVVNGIVTAGNWVFKWKSDSVNMAIRYTHSPNEVFNFSDVLLVWFGSQHNGRSPRAIKWTDPSIMQQYFDMGHNDGSFMRHVLRFLATDRDRTTSVNIEL
jgi:hypothetical protein